jgi:hypothetical protein
LPAQLRQGPESATEAKIALYFFTSFLFLFIFLKASASMELKKSFHPAIRRIIKCKHQKIQLPKIERKFLWNSNPEQNS